MDDSNSNLGEFQKIDLDIQSNQKKIQPLPRLYDIFKFWLAQLKIVLKRRKIEEKVWNLILTDLLLNLCGTIVKLTFYITFFFNSLSPFPPLFLFLFHPHDKLPLIPRHPNLSTSLWEIARIHLRSFPLSSLPTFIDCVKTASDDPFLQRVPTTAILLDRDRDQDPLRRVS